MTIELAKVFANLANDPSWPDGAIPFGSGSAYIKASKTPTLKLDKAKLALMVVEKLQVIWEYRDRAGKVSKHEQIDHQAVMLSLALIDYGIDTSNYENVLRRVEEAQ